MVYTILFIKITAVAMPKFIALLEFGLNRLHTRLKNRLSPQALSWFMLVKIGLYTYIICNMLKNPKSKHF